jgi:hypothetical protein
MSGSKRSRTHDENAFTFIDASTPVPKRVRRTTQSVSLAEIQNLQRARAEKELVDAEAKQELDEKVADEKKCEGAKVRVEQVLSSITIAGYDSLYGFVDELLNIRDQQISARVSRMLGRHGNDVLNSIRARQPSLVNEWVNLVSGEILTQEGQKLADYLRPPRGAKVSEVLLNFSLERVMSEAEKIAPTLCRILRLVSANQNPNPAEQLRKDWSLVRPRLHSTVKN